jgi:hypothetical protein
MNKCTWFTAALAVIIVTMTAPVFAQAPAAAPPEVIPVAEVATRAMAITELLNAISAKFASSPEIEKIKKSLPEISSNIDREAVRTVSILQQ